MALQLEPICYGTVTKLCLPYEIFGQGHIRLLFLPGMALSRKMWYNQILHFAQKPNYTVLVIENRGNGEVRNKKIQSWSTKAMARDVVRALDELRWTQDKSVHVCGMSMGGMISLQLALLAPKRIASLCLTSTCASWRPPPWSAKNAFAHATLGVTMSEEKKLQLILDTGFPKEHLDAPNARRHLPSITNRDRYISKADCLLSNNQKKFAFYGQVNAVVNHAVSEMELARIGAHIQFAFVVVGDKDALIHPRCAQTMADGIGCKLRTYVNAGHIIPWQCPAEYNRDLESLTTEADAFWAISQGQAANIVGQTP